MQPKSLLLTFLATEVWLAELSPALPASGLRPSWSPGSVPEGFGSSMGVTSHAAGGLFFLSCTTTTSSSEFSFSLSPSFIGTMGCGRGLLGVLAFFGVVGFAASSGFFTSWGLVLPNATFGGLLGWGLFFPMLARGVPAFGVPAFGVPALGVPALEVSEFGVPALGVPAPWGLLFAKEPFDVPLCEIDFVEDFASGPGFVSSSTAPSVITNGGGLAGSGCVLPGVSFFRVFWLCAAPCDVDFDGVSDGVAEPARLTSDRGLALPPTCPLGMIPSPTMGASPAMDLGLLLVPVLPAVHDLFNPRESCLAPAPFPPPLKPVSSPLPKRA